MLQARLRHTRSEKVALAAREKLDCVIRLAARVGRTRVENPRMLEAGETVEAGDELLFISGFDMPAWKPVKYTIGRPVRADEAGSFRRP